MALEKAHRYYHATRRLDLRGKKRDLFIETDDCTVSVIVVTPLTIIGVTPRSGVVFTSPGAPEIRVERIKEKGRSESS